MILNTPFIADWKSIRWRKKKLIDKSIQHENKNRKPNTYKIQDKLLEHKKIKQIWGALCRPISNNPGMENFKCHYK